MDSDECTTESQPTKRRVKCGNIRDITEFSRDKYAPDGRKYRCKDCARAYYQANAAHIKAKQRQYAQANPEKRRVNDRRYVQANIEKVRARKRAYQRLKGYDEYRRNYDKTHREQRRRNARIRYARNREHILAQKRASYAINGGAQRASNKRWRELHREDAALRTRVWRQENPEQQRMHGQIKRARKVNAPGSGVSLKQWQAIQKHYRFRCVYCGKKKPLTQDHITPLSKGGEHSIENVVPACHSCNTRKNAGAPLVPVQPLLFI